MFYAMTAHIFKFIRAKRQAPSAKRQAPSAKRQAPRLHFLLLLSS